MNNFSFQNTTQIHFGKGQISKLRNSIPTNSKILIAYGGGSIKKNGVLEQVKTALKSSFTIEFEGIEPNPEYETLMKAVELVKKENINFILGVGGGSVIDGCKFIAAAALYKDNPWEIVLSYGTKITAALPLGCILTLSATGSEMNSNSVITKAATKDKLYFSSPFVQPLFSILDPETTYTLPHKQIGNGVVDSFAHVAEQYMTFPVNAKVQDRFAEGLLLTLIEEGPKALENPKDYDIRANLMWAATMALNGLIGTGVPQDWATHLIGQEITALHSLDHGQTLAIILPALWTYKKDQKKKKLIQFAERVWNLNEGSDDLKILTAIEKTRHFFEKMGLPTKLSSYGLNESIISCVLNKLEEHGHTNLGEHGDITVTDAEKILMLAL